MSRLVLNISVTVSDAAQLAIGARHNLTWPTRDQVLDQLYSAIEDRLQSLEQVADALSLQIPRQGESRA